jgi:hypothetical protein
MVNVIFAPQGLAGDLDIHRNGMYFLLERSIPVNHDVTYALWRKSLKGMMLEDGYGTSQREWHGK